MIAKRYTLADLSKSGYSAKVATACTAVFLIGYADSRFSSAVTEILHSFENSLLD